MFGFGSWGPYSGKALKEEPTFEGEVGLEGLFFQFCDVTTHHHPQEEFSQIWLQDREACRTF